MKDDKSNQGGNIVNDAEKSHQDENQHVDKHEVKKPHPAGEEVIAETK